MSRGERLPAVSYALLPNLKNGPFFAIGEGSIIFVICCLHTSGQVVFHRTHGRGPPHITGRRVDTVTRGWVGAPNERTPFRFSDAVVVFVDRCLSKDSESRHFELNISLSFFQADPGPTSAQV